MAGKPVLRVTTDRTTHDDPSEDLLFILCDEELGHDGAFLVLETISDGHFIQVAGNFNTGSYRLERRAGSVDTHEHAHSSDVRRVHDELVAWAFPAAPRSVPDLDWQPGF